SAVLITRLVAKPLDELRAAFHAVGQGQLNVQIPLRRADEFGALVGDFNQMVMELRDKERLRRVFGLHVGEKVAQQILARDPGLGGTDQVVTLLFLDLRGFTARARPKPIRKRSSIFSIDFFKPWSKSWRRNTAAWLTNFWGT